MKSSSAYLGASQSAELCKELEQRGCAQQLEGAAALLSELEVQYQRVQATLAVERGRTQPVSVA